MKETRLNFLFLFITVYLGKVKTFSELCGTFDETKNEMFWINCFNNICFLFLLVFVFVFLKQNHALFLQYSFFSVLIHFSYSLSTCTSLYISNENNSKREQIYTKQNKQTNTKSNENCFVFILLYGPKFLQNVLQFLHAWNFTDTVLASSAKHAKIHALFYGHYLFKKIFKQQNKLILAYNPFDSQPRSQGFSLGTRLIDSDYNRKRYRDLQRDYKLQFETQSYTLVV